MKIVRFGKWSWLVFFKKSIWRFGWWNQEDGECRRCNGNGCPACDARNRGSKYNPEPY